MKSEDFDAILEQRLNRIKEVLISKGQEYSSKTDRLHNFKVAARIGKKEETPEQALLGMLKKHLVSIMDLVEETKISLEGITYRPNLNVWDEKLGDAINYLILLEALVIERRTNLGGVF